MFHIEFTGGAPGAAGFVHSYEDRGVAERIAQGIVGYLSRNRLPGHTQGVQLLDEQGQCLWRQTVGSKPERLN